MNCWANFNKQKGGFTLIKKSNYIFRGEKVSIQEHWTGEWEVFDSKSGHILFIVATKEKALEEYDRLNAST